jgi:long-chain fatty acid transport protein
MTKSHTTLIATLGLVGLAGTASANAFNINEHDPRVTGRAGATAASNDEPSAIVFNPAGIAHIRGTAVALGGSLYIAEGSYENATTSRVSTDSPPTPVPNLYIASRLTELAAVGLGVHFPYGLSVSWPEDHPQSTIAQRSSLRTMFISPVAALNLNQQVPGLSLGLGVDIVPASVKLERAVQFGDTRGSVTMAADAVGVGFRAGAMYHPPSVPGLKLGVMYRSQVGLDFEGQADIDIADPYRAQLPPDGDASTTIRLPQTVWGGIAYGADNLEVEVNAVWINWAATFTDDPSRGPGATSLSIALPGGRTSDTPQDYRNTVSYRLGLDYKLVPQKMNLRAGFIFDPTPIPTTTVTAQLPDVDRIALTAGASRQLTDSVDLHGGVLWIPSRSRDSTRDPAVPIFHGTYTVQALVLSLGVVGRFGATSRLAPAADPVASNHDRSRP